MNREFVYARGRGGCAGSAALAGRARRWLWAALCCGAPGRPCARCGCCGKARDAEPFDDAVTVSQATATIERVPPPHRPHAPRGRKATPETLSAVRCALSQLQGEPAPYRAPPPPPAATQPG